MLPVHMYILRVSSRKVTGSRNAKTGNVPELLRERSC